MTVAASPPSIPDAPDAGGDPQARFREIEQRLALLARVSEQAREGILIADLDGRIVDVNPGYCEITGYAREEVVGTTPGILRSGRHDAAFYAAMWREIACNGYPDYQAESAQAHSVSQ